MVYNQKLTDANIKKTTKDYMIGEKCIFILESSHENPCFAYVKTRHKSNCAVTCNFIYLLFSCI